MPGTSAGAAEVVLVDEADRELGTCEKVEAHRRGLLHRAVSVFAFDEAGRLLLQRRAATKYHSGGLWSNTACTHPRVGEPAEGAARRALREELALEGAALRHAFAFTYRAPVGDGLVEHEYDHVFVCRLPGAPTPNPAEVSATDLASADYLRGAMAVAPTRFTPWFRLLLEPVLRWRQEEGERAQ